MATPKFPTIDIPGVDTDKVAALAKDTAYVAIGLGVLAFQKAQVRRRELMDQVVSPVKAGRAQFDEFAKSFEQGIGAMDARLVALEAKLDSLVDQMTERLPKPAADLVDQAHGAAKVARTQLRDLIVRAA